MMRLISPYVHGILDYASVLVFFAAPSLFGFSGPAAWVAWALAVIHLLMTVLTAFPLGLAALIPFPLHGVVELAVAIALILLPWVLISTEPAPRNFFVAMGVAILIIWGLSNYGRRTSSA